MPRVFDWTCRDRCRGFCCQIASTSDGGEPYSASIATRARYRPLQCGKPRIRYDLQGARDDALRRSARELSLTSAVCSAGRPLLSPCWANLTYQQPQRHRTAVRRRWLVPLPHAPRDDDVAALGQQALQPNPHLGCHRHDLGKTSGRLLVQLRREEDKRGGRGWERRLGSCSTVLPDKNAPTYTRGMMK